MLSQGSVQLQKKKIKTAVEKAQRHHLEGQKCFNMLPNDHTNIKWKKSSYVPDIKITYKKCLSPRFSVPTRQFVTIEVSFKIEAWDTHRLQPINTICDSSQKRCINVAGWPSGLRRCVQVAVWFSRRGFESHFCQSCFYCSVIFTAR